MSHGRFILDTYSDFWVKRVMDKSIKCQKYQRCLCYILTLKITPRRKVKLPALAVMNVCISLSLGPQHPFIQSKCARWCCPPPQYIFGCVVSVWHCTQLAPWLKLTIAHYSWLETISCNALQECHQSSLYIQNYIGKFAWKICLSNLWICL